MIFSLKKSSGMAAWHGASQKGNLAVTMPHLTCTCRQKRNIVNTTDITVEFGPLRPRDEDIQTTIATCSCFSSFFPCTTSFSSQNCDE